MKKTITAQGVIDELDRIFAVHGFPLAMRSDNGPQFIAEVFQDYLKECGITHLRSTPYCPRANGEVERQNRSLLKAIRTAHAAGKNW